MSVTAQPSEKSVLPVLAKELVIYGERVNAAIDQCHSEAECAALEDVLQALSLAKVTLDRAVG